jgi:hypothetical protein
VRDLEYNDELAAEAVASSSQGLPWSGQEIEDESFNHAIEGIELFFQIIAKVVEEFKIHCNQALNIGFLFQICLEELLREDATNFGLEWNFLLLLLQVSPLTKSKTTKLKN